ncbi:hypothetical protein K438DRAFT_1928127 [Mycena galopus ATCC 62051]|nr:hypothetical protein K438DRAFT_1928127 [Mycena galopus ATCC 62051]
MTRNSSIYSATVPTVISEGGVEEPWVLFTPECEAGLAVLNAADSNHSGEDLLANSPVESADAIRSLADWSGEALLFVNRFINGLFTNQNKKPVFNSLGIIYTALTIIAVRVGLGKSVESVDSFMPMEQPRVGVPRTTRPSVAPANAVENRILYFRPDSDHHINLQYSSDKVKDLYRREDPAWEEPIVTEIDSALDKWVDSIPEHLGSVPRGPFFFKQSAILYCAYYHVQMTAHRPFIPQYKPCPTGIQKTYKQKIRSEPLEVQSPRKF